MAARGELRAENPHMTSTTTIRPTTTTTHGQTTLWAIDPTHTAVEFSVRHMMITTVKGTFKGVRGTIRRSATLEESTIEAAADVASIDTGAADRDAHLKSADFFDAANHPTLTLVSRAVEPAGDDRYKLVADLTMRGVTREVAFDLEFEGEGKDPWGGERLAATATAVVNRRDWGLNWNAALETGGVLVSDKVKITIHAQAVKQVPPGDGA